MGKVTTFGGENSAIVEYKDGVPVFDPDKVLQNCVGLGLKEVLILGWDDDDMMFSAGTQTKTSDILLIMEFFKHKLMNGDYLVD